MCVKKMNEMQRVSLGSLLVVAALIHEAVAAPLAPARGEETDAYSRLQKSDCARQDVTPQPACGGNRNLSVAMLEACCDTTRGCGGFNTHGVIKDAACAAHVHNQPTTDLYLKPACNTFKTNPSCPPRCIWTPAASGGGAGTCSPAPPAPPPAPAAAPRTPWPLPNDARMGTGAGATTVQLGHGFAISRVGPACPTLDAAVQRYQNQAVGLHVARPQGDGGDPVLLHQLLVLVADLDETYPQLDTTGRHEAYNLTIPADGGPATVAADTIWGAMWGMESFSQLVRFNFTTEAYGIANAPWRIEDAVSNDVES